MIILTPHCNRIDYIYFQLQSLKKFLKEPFDYICINDGKGQNRIDIENACKHLNITCANVPDEIRQNRRLVFPNTQQLKARNPSTRHTVALQYAYNKIAHIKDYVMILDSDLFLTASFSIEEYLKDHDLGYVEQTRKNIKYMWPGLVMLNNKNLPNPHEICFDCGKVNGINTDTGGWSHFYLQKYPDIKKRNIEWTGPGNSINYLIENKIPNNDLLEYLKEKVKINNKHNYRKDDPDNPHSEIGATVFLHFRIGSNWEGNSLNFHKDHQVSLYQYLSKICDLSMITFDQIRLTQKFLRT